MSDLAKRRQEQIAAALDQARARDGRGAFIGFIELYCENADCAAWEVEIHFKEFGGSLPSRVVCPACRRQLKLHGVQTLAEHERAFERDARASVNMQRWQRDNPDALAVPLGIFLDEGLS